MSLLSYPTAANDGVHPSSSETAPTLSISPTQYAAFRPLCYLQNLKIKTVFETTFMPHSFSFLILWIPDFYLGSWFFFFPPNTVVSRARICHSGSLLCKEASFNYFTWTAEIMVQIRRCHYGFSMPCYKEIVIHSYSAESRLFIFYSQSPHF